MAEAVIADAGPLIALSRIDALTLLRSLFGRVLVTETVREEVLPAEDYPGKTPLAKAFDDEWMIGSVVPPSSWQPLNPGLDAGERSAIALALQMPGSLLVIDDRAGRAEARSHHVSIIGTAAVIGLAKLQGLVPAARPILEQLRPAGYFIHPNVIEMVLRDVGE